MNRTDAHPVELAIVAALVVAEALLVLVAATVALALTVLPAPAAPTPPAAAPAVAPPIKCPSSGQAPVPDAVAGLPERQPALAQQVPLAPPRPHPLVLIAAELEALPVAALRQMVGTKSKRHNKAALIAMAAACS